MFVSFGFEGLYRSVTDKIQLWSVSTVCCLLTFPSCAPSPLERGDDDKWTENDVTTVSLSHRSRHRRSKVTSSCRSYHHEIPPPPPLHSPLLYICLCCENDDRPMDIFVSNKNRNATTQQNSADFNYHHISASSRNKRRHGTQTSLSMGLV